jgi:hypothetical protein
VFSVSLPLPPRDTVGISVIATAFLPSNPVFSVASISPGLNWRSQVYLGQVNQHQSNPNGVVAGNYVGVACRINMILPQPFRVGRDGACIPRVARLRRGG